MQTFNIHSSCGELTADIETGKVISGKLDVEYSIIQFDVYEFETTYGKKVSGNVDILDLGYWYCYNNNVALYETPAYDWRADREADRVASTPLGIFTAALKDEFKRRTGLEENDYIRGENYYQELFESGDTPADIVSAHIEDYDLDDLERDPWMK